MAWPHAQRILERATAMPVAPHVTMRLVTTSGGNPHWLAALASTLTPAQLTGYSSLPDPLPAHGIHAGGFKPEDLEAADRRLLLVASLASSEHTGLVVDAAAVSADRLVTGPVRRLLRLRSGYFTIDPTARTLLLNSASSDEIGAVHASLAGSSRRMGNHLYAAWHDVHERPPRRADVTSLLRLARLQISRGTVHTAQRVAEVAADAAGRIAFKDAETAALEIASHAALWGGHVIDARRIITRISRRARGEIASRLSDAADALLAEPAGDDDPRGRFIRQIRMLGPTVTAPADRVVFSGLRELVDAWGSDPDRADQILARLILTTRRAHPDWRTRREGRPPSPLAEAYVRVLQTTFRLQAGDRLGSALTLDEALPRLPLAVTGRGAGSGIMRSTYPRERTKRAFLIDQLDRFTPDLPLGRDGADTPPAESRTAIASSLETPTVTPRPAQRRLPAAWYSVLTVREREVLGLLASGPTPREIGALLHLSKRTIEGHIARIYQKLGVHGRGELIHEMHRLSRESAHLPGTPSQASE